jgi:hypothetical protein
MPAVAKRAKVKEQIRVIMGTSHSSRFLYVHLVRQTRKEGKLLKNRGGFGALAGRIPPWMVDFGQ